MTGASPAQRHPEGPWWESFFDEDFAELWLSDDDPLAQTRRVDGLMRALRLRAGSRLFDQCCGVGRVALPMVARGVHVDGVDGVPRYVERASERCARLSGGGRGAYRFTHDDALRYVPSEPCDAAINWYTSFGYAADDATNLRMLRCAFDALRPGGRFALDYPDMVHVRANFRPRSERRRDTPSGRYRVVREARLDAQRQMLVDRWIFTAPSGATHARWGETRLYSPADLAQLVSAVGFRVVGRIDEEDVGYARGAGRCIWLAERPGDEAPAGAWP